MNEDQVKRKISAFMKRLYEDSVDGCIRCERFKVKVSVMLDDGTTTFNVNDSMGYVMDHD
jgi:hypothetical protein